MFNTKMFKFRIACHPWSLALQRLLLRSYRTLRVLAGISVLAVGLSGCPNVSTNPPAPPNPDWKITASWQYDFSNFVPCSASITKGCVNSFTWGYVQGGALVPLKTSSISVCSGATQPQTCTDTVNSTLGIGAYNIYVVANGVDNTGAGVSSIQANSPPYSTTLTAPVNLSAIVQ
jgi:hypothetical protein